MSAHPAHSLQLQLVLTVPLASRLLPSPAPLFQAPHSLLVAPGLIPSACVVCTVSWSLIASLARSLDPSSCCIGCELRKGIGRHVRPHDQLVHTIGLRCGARNVAGDSPKGEGFVVNPRSSSSLGRQALRLRLRTGRHARRGRLRQCLVVVTVKEAGAGKEVSNGILPVILGQRVGHYVDIREQGWGAFTVSVLASLD